MKFFVVLAVAVATFTWAAATENVEAIKASRERMKAAHQKCQDIPEFHIDEEVLKNVMKGKAQPPANFKDHTFCISKEIGWQNADGSINKESIISRAKAMYGQIDDFEAKLDECFKVQATPQETAVYLWNCYIKHSPRPVGTSPQ